MYIENNWHHFDGYSKLSRPSVSSGQGTEYTIYGVMFSTGSWTHTPLQYVLQNGASLQYATFIDDDGELIQTGISECFNSYSLSNFYTGACNSPVIAADSSSVVWTAGMGGTEDIMTFAMDFTGANVPDEDPDYTAYENWWPDNSSEISTLDGMPPFAYYPEISEYSESFGNTIVFRQGNNKNSDILVCFTGDMPPGLSEFSDGATGELDRIMLTDIDNLNEEYDVRGFDDWPDISNDGNCIVFMSQADNHGEIYYVDLFNLTTNTGSAPEIFNRNIWQDIRRLTWDLEDIGLVSHPRVSDRIPISDLSWD